MSSTRYGGALYGTVLYGDDAQQVFVSSSFVATANGYGRALVEWTRPGGAWTEQRLVRSLIGPPIDVEDGDTVLLQSAADSSTRHQDEDLTGGVRYYYALFVLDIASSVFLRTGVDEVLALTDYGYTQRLYTGLPQVFRSTDIQSLTTVEDEESTFLFRFLRLFGIGFDATRAELEGVRSLYDPRVLSSRLLPSLAEQVGLQYEPELNDRSLRRVISNIFRLYGTRGTLAGIRELTTSFTGWDTQVRLGTNIALDRLEAGPDGGQGRWVADGDGSLAYVPFTESNRGPAGDGALVLTVGGGQGPALLRTGPIDVSPLERRQGAIPILPGLDYRVSMYARTTATGQTIGVQARIIWLDAAGVALGVGEIGPDNTVNDTWADTPESSQNGTFARGNGRPYVTATAPADARYLEASMKVEDGEPGDAIQFCALQVEESSEPGQWRPAREIIVYVRGDLTNYVGNTSGFGLSAEGWSKGLASADDVGPYLSFVNLADNDPRVSLVDSLAVVVPGDTNPDAPGPTYADVAGLTNPSTYQQRAADFLLYRDASNAEVRADPTVNTATYTASIRTVEAGQKWSVLVDVAGVFGGYEREVFVGFALYDGDTLVGYDLQRYDVNDTTETLGHELTVPADATYDRIAMTFRSTDDIVLWRNAALERVQLADARQFDGSTPSSTQDYFWEGVPYRSPSHFYRRRSVRTLRLDDLLRDFVPHPASYRLVFAPPDVIPDSPRASSGSDLDPDDNPQTQVGARIRSRWATTNPAGTDAPIEWLIESRQVTTDAQLLWVTEQLNKEQPAGWTTFELAGAEVASTYTVTTTVTDDQPSSWAVTSSVGADATTSWNTETIPTYAENQKGTYDARTAAFPTYNDASGR